LVQNFIILIDTLISRLAEEKAALKKRIDNLVFSNNEFENKIHTQTKTIFDERKEKQALEDQMRKKNSDIHELNETILKSNIQIGEFKLNENTFRSQITSFDNDSKYLKEEKQRLVENMNKYEVLLQNKNTQFLKTQAEYSEKEGKLIGENRALTQRESTALEESQRYRELGMKIEEENRQLSKYIITFLNCT
jgi:chromosome segregation ATPase